MMLQLFYRLVLVVPMALYAVNGHEGSGGGDPVIQGFRDRMVFAGDFVKANRPGIGQAAR
ncbi:MAG: hypothetical protein HYZ71_06575 [Deltaproteobacteria bacterium]|nr:hypothetical protein [Deltaproteobacteria bacterium]